MANTIGCSASPLDRRRFELARIGSRRWRDLPEGNVLAGRHRLDDYRPYPDCRWEHRDRSFH